MGEPSTIYENVHGRKPGRGIRPYLLLLKYLFVSIFVGGLVSMLIQGFILPGIDTLQDWQRRGMLLRHSYVWVIVPGLLGGMLTGLIMLWAHFGALIRMRWLQVKLVLIAVCVPSLHFYMRGKADALHATLARGTPQDLQTAAELWRDLRTGTVASLVFALMIVFLGRIKPRLGQNYGRTFNRQVSSAAPPTTDPPPAVRSRPA